MPSNELQPTASSASNKVSLTPSQEAICDGAISFAKNNLGVKSDYIVAGLAGTGKTTTMGQFLERLRDSGIRAAVCTPTGKAAHVINTKQKAFPATTLHKVLTKRPYDALAKIHTALDDLEEISRTRDLSPEEKEKEVSLLRELDASKKEGGNLSFEPAEEDAIYDKYDCLVFDEASMIGKQQTYDKLIGHLQMPCLYFGDGGQLPPVKDVAAINFQHANHKLTQILRQGADSGILQLAHGVHKGQMMSVARINEYADLSVVKSSAVAAVKDYAVDHQFVVWMNKERHALNPIARKARGFNFEHLPEEHQCRPLPGEYLMVDVNNEQARLLKGQMLKVISCSEHPAYPQNPYLCYAIVEDDQGRERALPLCLDDMTPDRLLRVERDDSKLRWIANKVGIQVMFPYAITAHKAQGSEWDKVCVVGSMMPEGHKDWKTWWYTAVTRAKKELVVASYYFGHDSSR